ncbi:MAG: hypothetical protein Hens2KO_25150 [Henriciella sp.]
MQMADDQTDDSLAQALRKKYESIQDEKIPDKLQRLIDALKAAERQEKQSD